MAAEFLAKLTLRQRHSHIPIYVSKVAPRANNIPLNSATDAFLGMPKKSAAHKDGWTWELVRDAAQKPVTATLLRKFAERFSYGTLPINLWSYLAFVLMYSLHKKLLEDRSPSKRALRPITMGFVLTRFGCKVMVKMKRIYVAKQLLLSHHFWFGINGGVQQVILACTISLEINPTKVMMDLDSPNAHTFCNRGKLEEELDLNVV